MQAEWLVHDNQAEKRTDAFQLAPVGQTTGGTIVVGKVAAHRLSHRRIIIDDQDITRPFDVLVHIFGSRQSSGYWQGTGQTECPAEYNPVVLGFLP